MEKKDLAPYKLAQKLRSAAARCTRTNADVALLCEHALAAADWLESEAEDLMGLRGSVTYAHIEGRITPGCVLNATPNEEQAGHRQR